MELFADIKTEIKRDYPLGPLTWFNLGGPAQYFAEPQSIAELSAIVKTCTDNNIPLRVLGDGANLLVDDAGVNGMVVRLSADCFNEINFEGGVLKASAGKSMPTLVLYCVRHGYSGLEGLTGIPGTVGGCVRMNAGGVFGDIGAVVESVEVMGDDGVVFTKTHDELVFGYRTTNLSSQLIISASFGVIEDDPHRILRQVKEIWMYKKNSQPLGHSNAGCIFKNPRGLSAGALIDQAGLKGHRIGGAFVSEKHANFILADKDAHASDVLKLINEIREAVYKRFEVYLELELEVW